MEVAVWGERDAAHNSSGKHSGEPKERERERERERSDYGLRSGLVRSAALIRPSSLSGGTIHTCTYVTLADLHFLITKHRGDAS